MVWYGGRVGLGLGIGWDGMGWDGIGWGVGCPVVLKRIIGFLGGDCGFLSMGVGDYYSGEICCARLFKGGWEAMWEHSVGVV